MKWRIKGPVPGTSFSDASKMVLVKRIKILVKAVRKYFEEENAENLHEIRIAIRRLRYTLEVFYCCFDKNIFTSFYGQIESLQDLSGEVRDLDVLKDTALSLISDKVEISRVFLKKLAVRRIELNEKLKLELMKFIHGSEIKNFRNQLK